MPPGAANAFSELSSIIRTLKSLFFTLLVSDNLYIRSSVYSNVNGSVTRGA